MISSAQGELPVPCYVKNPSGNRKERMKRNPDSSKNFMLRWVTNGRGQLAVVQPQPHPADGAHTAKIIPAVLTAMTGKEDKLRQWVQRVIEKQDSSVWCPRSVIDGDLLQVFAALVTSGYYGDDVGDSESSSDEGSSGEGEDVDNSKE